MSSSPPSETIDDDGDVIHHPSNDNVQQSSSDDNNINTLDNNIDNNNNTLDNNSIDNNIDNNNNNKKEIKLEDLLTEEEIEIASKVLEKLSFHSYLLTNPKLSNLILSGSLVFKRKITKEEQVEMKREQRKKIKEKVKNHDTNILNGTLMKQKKMNEVHFLKQQIRMIPNAPNSEVPSLTLEEEEVIIESIPYDESLHSHLDNNPITSPNIIIINNNNNTNDSNDNSNNSNDNNNNNNTTSDNSTTTTTSNSNSNNSSNNSNSNNNRLKKAIRCYICHEKTNQIHEFYHKMCCKCGEYNLEKRYQQVDLSNKICLVTGGRIKIGYYTALKLLRSNAEMVIVTSRFPKDTSIRYSNEPDFNIWKDKLKIYGIDFKHIPSVIKFTEHLLNILPRLDILINCAAQTIRKPTAYYEHVARFELTTSLQDLSQNERNLLPLDFNMEINHEQELIALKMLSSMNVNNNNMNMNQLTSSNDNDNKSNDDNNKSDKNDNNNKTQSSEHINNDNTNEIHLSNNTEESRLLLNNTSNNKNEIKYSSILDPINISTSSLICQIPILDEDKSYNEQSFPRDIYDVNQNQADFRSTNSWIATLQDVPVFEMLEVQTINVTAPFILTSKLKPLLIKGMSFIVNVSSMEGQFYRRSKGVTHPHLNMAKASLNMMTRTSASDYARDNIYMTSVDTGWNNDENPLTDLDNISQTYFCPLDEIDGAARILDPIYQAITGKQLYFGVFLKNYEPFRW
ncbi:predicted protein [Naegleria gruberi]|uniref:Predicted protein n=1 Tax=Naegleria gruberi TaxID=5762 RepID=D2V3F5_NAEGR|nr:uncharacterized protein NAEGRDRAFT_63339 [Naegleria gruberi]EFC48628.1 predicted protein [Naegleria gruberi]|eukprot:XP_002681372.1 predicted protein [Naegleria gruberi strain NEG-M]